MDITPIMEDEVEKNMEHEMETGFQKGAAMGVEETSTNAIVQ